ncbi:hypothetical protein BMS3Abin04_01120 [bacterium BMS3Abin04]|nr:hypothetical protein BMS3Abin04_01120 [bacterium BMS3Abin04]
MINELEMIAEELQSPKTKKNLKKAWQDGLFWFGIVLFSLIGLNYLGNIFTSHIFAVGINDVYVSLLGFANVFIIRFTSKLGKYNTL